MELVTGADARLPIVLVRIPETAILFVCEKKSALDRKNARGNLRDRTGGVSGLRGGLNRTADVRIKAANVAVVALRIRPFYLISQTEVERQFVSHFPIVVEKD